MPHRIAIVIVNYRTAGLTVDCLRSLAPQVGPVGARVIVVEGGSADDSPAVLARAIAENHWSDWATLLPLARNGGFAFANNAALRIALAGADRPQYIHLLNPDTLVRPGAVAALADFLDAHPRAAIAGSRLEDPDAAPQRSAFRFPSIPSEFENAIRLGPVSKLLARFIVAPPPSDAPHPTDWLAGASIMIRAEVFDAVGLLDESYFMYYEEVDFQFRAARAGWPAWYVPQSRVVHLVGQSSGVTDPKKRRRRPAYWFESRRRYFSRNLGRFDALLADAAWMIGHALWRARRHLTRRPDTDPPHLLGDFARNSVFAKGFPR